MAAVRHHELGKISIFCSRDLYLHVVRHFHSEFRVNRPIRRQYLAKNDFLYGVRPPSWIWKISIFFLKFPCSEWKFASVYQIWSKSVKLQLKYGDKAIFKMAAVHHLEFSKIAVLVTWRISACDPSSPFQISRWSANMAPIYSQITIFNMASVRHVGFVMTSSYCIQKLHFTFPTTVCCDSTFIQIYLLLTGQVSV